jgi:hypothetical protein
MRTIKDLSAIPDTVEDGAAALVAMCGIVTEKSRDNDADHQNRAAMKKAEPQALPGCRMISQAIFSRLCL